MNTEHYFVDASQAWDEGRLSDAFELFSLGANRGDESCQLSLGYFYDTGLHVQQDLNVALIWYMRAYRQGDAPAANNIAVIYRDLGKGIQAIRWFKRAVRAGNGDSLVTLGKMYEFGCCVPRSPSNAMQYYTQLLTHPNTTVASREYAAEAIRRLKA